MAYIYQIVNDVNQKLYVGKTEFSIEKRFKEHCRDAFKPNKEKRPLYAAMKKYGIEHFHIELIEETEYPEEREIYWIEQKRSFKNGYNATIGGDGKRYIDYDAVILTYLQLKCVDKTAETLNISKDQVSLILKSNKVPIKSSYEIIKERYGKPVNMYFKDTKEYICTFPTMRDAGKYLIENGKSNCKITTIRQHISEVCSKKRQSAAGYYWEYA